LDGSQGTNDNSLPFAENDGHPARTIVTKPEKLDFPTRSTVVGSEMGLLENFASVPAKQLAFIKVKKTIGAIWIGTLRQHGRSGEEFAEIQFYTQRDGSRSVSVCYHGLNFSIC
jgi:hypothetical protein